MTAIAVGAGVSAIIAIAWGWTVDENFAQVMVRLAITVPLAVGISWAIDAVWTRWRREHGG